MKTPFSIDEFLTVFENYNLALWPIQILFYLLVLISIIAIIRNRPPSGRVVFSILTFYWVWMGLVYHILYFSVINKAAYFFGSMFIVQGIIFLYYGVIKKKIEFKADLSLFGAIGITLIVYALVIYPIAGYAGGHVYPRSPTFGVPCPTTIFTFGILLFSVNRIPWYIIIIPFLWSVVGFFAAINLSIMEDFGLFIAGIVSTVILLFFKPHRKTEP